MVLVVVYRKLRDLDGLARSKDWELLNTSCRLEALDHRAVVGGRNIKVIIIGSQSSLLLLLISNWDWFLSFTPHLELLGVFGSLRVVYADLVKIRIFLKNRGRHLLHFHVPFDFVNVDVVLAEN